ncbi:NADH-quinone oxidoreductase subunit C [Thermicanus aegyptius]|uniref:NADH-quinone oxidoreductase subunit C n=1 Tax=Thermicanus aegyptius TaxID=94009 RepID=UPI000416016F|nr:NADH-quinone oxidoreductase subunit C [Thermicanus aegyptius]
MADDKDLELAKAKAAAAAKAKAAAAAKAKAAAAAKAKAAADAKETVAEGGAPEAQAESAGAADPDAKAKAIAAAKAKAAAAAAAKAKAAGGEPKQDATADETEKPSKNRPLLEFIVKRITEKIDSSPVEQAFINFHSKEVPTLYIKKEKWLETARLLKEDPELSFDYLNDLHGIDFETHMEVFYSLQSIEHKTQIAVHVKTERDGGRIPSVTSIWPGANWQEREVYDLFGLSFEGHPDLVRILLPDHWVGHPLRKDYKQYDEEV